jgi:hypothetical protein
MNQTKQARPEMIKVRKETYHKLLEEWAADLPENKLDKPWTHVRFYYRGEDEAVVYGHEENVGTWSSTDGAQGVSIGDVATFDNQAEWFDFLDEVKTMERTE